MQIEINTEQIDNLAQFLNAMANRITDFSEPLDVIANLMLADVMESFTTGGADLGLSWAPLSEATIARWGDHEFGKGPSGNLFAGIHKFVRPFVAGVESSAPHTHFFESGTKQGTSAHTAGGKIKIHRSPASPGNLHEPGREFLLLTDDRTEQYVNTILDFALGEGQFSAAA